jgi:flagellar basal body-associated protein FliL
MKQRKKKKMSKKAKIILVVILLLIIGVLGCFLLTNDKEIEKILANKDKSQIEILGIGIFGINEEVDKLTKNYSLWK